jgi:hypothetical protein
MFSYYCQVSGLVHCLSIPNRTQHFRNKICMSSFYLKTETDQVFETLCSVQNTEMVDRVQKLGNINSNIIAGASFLCCILWCVNSGSNTSIDGLGKLCWHTGA